MRTLFSWPLCIKLIILSTLATLIVLYFKRTVSTHIKNKLNMGDPKQWKELDVYGLSIPDDITSAAAKIAVKESRLEINIHDQKLSVFVQEVKHENAKVPSFLLLHGASFNSNTWRTLGTLQLLGAMGYRTVAVDLPGPGFAKTQSTGTLSENHKEFLLSLMKSLQLNDHQAVIVSPSRSGLFSLPLLVDNPEEILGFVPVAPVGTDKLNQAKLKNIKVPTIVVYGSEDKSLGIRTRDDLRVLPLSQVIELPNAKHPAYLDQPDKWHTLLYNFAKQLEKDHNITKQK